MGCGRASDHGRNPPESLRHRRASAGREGPADVLHHLLRAAGRLSPDHHRRPGFIHKSRVRLRLSAARLRHLGAHAGRAPNYSTPFYKALGPTARPSSTCEARRLDPSLRNLADQPAPEGRELRAPIVDRARRRLSSRRWRQALKSGIEGRKHTLGGLRRVDTARATTPAKSSSTVPLARNVGEPRARRPSCQPRSPRCYARRRRQWCVPQNPAPVACLGPSYFL